MTALALMTRAFQLLLFLSACLTSQKIGSPQDAVIGGIDLQLHHTSGPFPALSHSSLDRLHRGEKLRLRFDLHAASSLESGFDAEAVNLYALGCPAAIAAERRCARSESSTSHVVMTSPGARDLLSLQSDLEEPVPTGHGVPNEAGLAFYDRILDALLPAAAVG